MNKEFPKVLVVSINAWRDNTGINTLIDFFKNWDKNKLAQIYTRSAMPNTKICDNFFQISENAVMKSVLKRKIKTGKKVYNQTENSCVNNDANDEAKRYEGKSKFRFILNICRELVWWLGNWKTKELNDFIENFDADVLFMPIYPTIYMGRIQKYIIKKTKKPVVSYLADDNYTYKNVSKNPISFLMRFILRKYVKFIVKGSSKLLVIAPKQKEEYDKIFGVNSDILTKGLDFSDNEFKEYTLNKPIKMVYTGKLIIGRWNSLAAIAESFAKINNNENKIELDIYTTDILNEKQKLLLNKNGCSVKGALTLEEVKKVQSQADILVFVESLEKRYKYTARLSFSTKITDYLKSGKCIFAIGDKEIAPIDYFIKYDSAITATSYEEISEKLNLLVNNNGLIHEYAKKSYNCGKENHNTTKMDNVIYGAITNAYKAD